MASTDNRVSYVQNQRQRTGSEMTERNSRRWTVVLRRHRESRRGSYMLKMIQNHYTLLEPVKSPLELSRESWLFPAVSSVAFNRWFIMPAAFMIQFCCGSLFTWIVFNKPIDKFIYGSVADVATPITFYIAVAIIGISAVIMGPWLERKGPKLASFLGATLFFIGNILVAVALLMKNKWLVYVGYGVSGAYGIGLCFISPVSVLQKWFPDRRGLASGIGVFGFGAGSLVNGKLELVLINELDLPLTFVILGVAYFLCIFCAGLILRTPPPNYAPPHKQQRQQQQHSMRRLATISENLEASSVTFEHKDWTLLEALGSTEFRLMYLMFLANLLLNLGSTSKWPSMITDVFGRSEEHASNIILVRGCFDLFGRIFFPLLSDYLGRKNTYFLILTTQLCILIAFNFILMSSSYWIFVLCMWIVAAAYGGGFGVLSVFLVEKFGAVNVGPLFSVCITAWSLSGLIGGLSYQVITQAIVGNVTTRVTDPLPYIATMWVFLGIVIVGWIALIFVKPTAKDTEVYEKVKQGDFLKQIKSLKCCTRSST